MDFDGGDDFDGGEPNEYADIAGAGDEVAPEFNQKDSILFVIDARRSMCEPSSKGGPSCFSKALGCALGCMRDRILSGDRDLVGVLLFGTEQMKVPNGQQGFPHIYLLQELEEPSAASMRQLELLIKAGHAEHAALDGEEEEAAAATAAAAAAVAVDFGHAAESSALELANVLWVTSMLFNSAASKNTRRRLYVMTNDDNPCAASAAARSRALTRSRDLQDARVWIEPFFFAPPPPATFDLSEGSFWRELVGTVRQNYKGPPPKEATAGAPAAAADGSVEVVESTDGGGLGEDLSMTWVSTCVLSVAEDALRCVRRKARRKRITWQSELTIHEGYALSFLMVSVIRVPPPPTKVKLYALDNTPITTETAQIDASHGGVIEKGDVYRGFNYGGKWVYFEPYELAAFGKEGLTPGLTLLGFKDHDRLKIQHHLGPAKFLEPCERVPGSVDAMTALVHAMLAKGKVGIARMLRGKVGQARLVGLLPQRHVCDEVTGSTRLPCGFHVVDLPFAEDVRSVKKPAALTEDDFTPEQLEATRSLARALELPSGVSPVGRVANPASTTHFRYLECLALHVPGAEVEPTVDHTVPDTTWLAQKRPQLDAFQEAFGLPFTAELEASASTAKRPRITAGGSASGTAAAAKATAPPDTVAEWQQACRDGRLESLTMPTLKEFLKAQGLAVGGKKGDLVARVHDWLEAIPAADTNGDAVA